MAQEKNPQTITIRGRLSFPALTMPEAIARNSTSAWPKKPEDIAPDYSIVVEQTTLDKLVDHVKNVFLPYCLAQSNAGQKKNALDAKQIARLIKAIDSDWTEQPPYIAIKPLSEKTAALAPSAVASIKVIGNKLTNIVQLAIVRDAEELLDPDDPNVTTFPAIMPINKTVHQMYPGCQVKATLNLYAFLSGTTPGFSASAGTLVFFGDDERFGGGGEIDEEEMFLDD